MWSPIYDPSVFGRLGSGSVQSVARSCIPISSLLTIMVYLLSFLSYLAGSKSVSARPSPYTVLKELLHLFMTNKQIYTTINKTLGFGSVKGLFNDEL